MVFLISTAVFSSVTLLLVSLLLMVQSRVVKKGDSKIVINDDEEKNIHVPVGTKLLSALSDNGIFIPSACGGGGSCGMCKTQVFEGGRGILPTELAHLNRKEKKDNVRLACQLKIKEDMNIRIAEEYFNVKKYNATVVSNANVATFIKELILKTDPGEELEFKAGSYVQIDIPEHELSFTEFRTRVDERFRPDWDRFNFWGLRSKTEAPIFRAYSLSNPPAEKNMLRFTVRIATPPPGQQDVAPGAGSSYIFNLKTGDKVTLSGPYGEFFVKETDREMCFIGGGAGMAPLRSQILHQLNAVKTNRRISFWYGARSRQELFFYDEFRTLEKKNENFSYHVALSSPLPDDDWDGPTGFIHIELRDSFLAEHEDPSEVEYYLCGPPMMIDAVIEMLDDFGVDQDMIAYDKF